MQAVPGLTCDSARMAVITCATGLPMPSLMGDFSHLMPDAAAQASLRNFQYQLQGFSREIHARNLEREIPLTAFIPEELNVSVAI